VKIIQNNITPKYAQKSQRTVEDVVCEGPPNGFVIYDVIAR